MSLHGPSPSWEVQDDLDAQARLAEERWDEEDAEREVRLFLEERRSCRLPWDQRMSEATRVGLCEMRGIDPFPEADAPYLAPRPLVQEPDQFDGREAA